MAISKQQPMRPAEIDLIDAVNEHEQTLNLHTQSLNTLANGLASETSNREAADIALGVRIDNEAQARTNADTALGIRIDNETQARTAADTALGRRIDNEAQARANGDAALQGQIGEGFSPSFTIAQSLSATNAAVSDIETEIGNGFDSQNTITAYTQALDLFLGTRTDLDDTVVNSILALAASSETLESFVSRFKIGCINNVTIPANDSISTSATFAEPFDSSDSCVLFAQVITNELASLFTYTLIDCTYSGFSYSIANSDADAHTVSLGYIAVKVN